MLLEFWSRLYALRHVVQPSLRVAEAGIRELAAQGSYNELPLGDVSFGSGFDVRLVKLGLEGDVDADSVFGRSSRRALGHAIDLGHSPE